MKGTAFFLVVLMAAILLLLGEYKQTNKQTKRLILRGKNKHKINIFNYWKTFGVRTAKFHTDGPQVWHCSRQ